MLPCGGCDGRVFGTERALASHVAVVHEDEATHDPDSHVYRPSKKGDLTSPCEICGLPRNARRHDRTPHRPPSWER